MTTQIEFFEANQVDGKLTDAQMSQMLNLPEGDSTTVQSNVPDVAAVPTPPAAVVVDPVVPAATTEQPVILAKDGVHTIPYEKLAEARAGEQAQRALAEAAQAQAAELQKLLEDALKKAPTAQPAAPAPAPAQFDPSVFGDYSEEAIAKGVAKLVADQTATMRAEMESRLAAALEPLQTKHVETEADKHYAAINAKHPDVESVVPSAEFANWVNAQPSVVRAAIQATVDSGPADQVIEVLDAYKAATSKTPVVETGKPDAAALAQAAIAKAQTAPPSSLTEIPTGSPAATSELESIQNMSQTQVMKMFDGKTPEQIRDLVSRLI